MCSGRSADARWTKSDIRRVVNEGRARASVDGREVIHALPLTFTVDQTDGVSDPRGLFCEELTARLHIVDAVSTSLRSLSACIAHCDLDLAELVSAPMAAGLATLVADERELGATVIDMGGGTTGMAVFGEGQLLHTAQLPVGGVHVTNDLARMLSTPVAHAERLKTLYGNAQSCPDDEREMLPVPLVGEEEHQIAKVPRSMVVNIIRPRLEETFEMVKERLDGSGLNPRRRDARGVDRWRVSTRRRARTGRAHPQQAGASRPSDRAARPARFGVGSRLRDRRGDAGMGGGRGAHDARRRPGSRAPDGVGPPHRQFFEGARLMHGANRDMWRNTAGSESPRLGEKSL